MKKILFAIFIFLLNCQSDPVELTTEIGRLEAKLRDTQKASDQLDIDLQHKFQTFHHLKNEIETLQKVRQGKHLFHIVTIQVKQERQGLDILDLEAQVKDHLNSFQFEIAVDPIYYGLLTEGEKIVEKFRGGSFLFRGSTSSMSFRVIKKRIEAL